jgi:hypothetical protein
MVAGMSGATPGSGGGAELDDSDGRLMLLHAPRSIVSAEAIARLATTRAVPDPIIAFPQTSFLAAPVLQPTVKHVPEQ